MNKLKLLGSYIIQWLFLVPVKGGIGGIVHPLAVYTTYIPLIYCLLGGYMLPTTFYGNQKQPLTNEEKPCKKRQKRRVEIHQESFQDP